MASEIRFMWNGIKVNGKLHPAFYSISRQAHTIGSHTIPAQATVYARRCNRFPQEVQAAFAVKNDSDSMTDYFESDHFSAEPTHPLYPAIEAAAKARAEHDAKLTAKREEKCRAYHAARLATC